MTKKIDISLSDSFNTIDRFYKAQVEIEFLIDNKLFGAIILFGSYKTQAWAEKMAYNAKVSFIKKDSQFKITTDNKKVYFESKNIYIFNKKDRCILDFKEFCSRFNKDSSFKMFCCSSYDTRVLTTNINSLLISEVLNLNENSFELLSQGSKSFEYELLHPSMHIKKDTVDFAFSECIDFIHRNGFTFEVSSFMDKKKTYFSCSLDNGLIQKQFYSNALYKTVIMACFYIISEKNNKAFAFEYEKMMQEYGT